MAASSSRMQYVSDVPVYFNNDFFADLASGGVSIDPGLCWTI